jgi:hypothetical protein
MPRGQSRPQESKQDDKWSFCLTAGTLCPRESGETMSRRPRRNHTPAFKARWRSPRLGPKLQTSAVMHVSDFIKHELAKRDISKGGSKAPFSKSC